MALTPLVMYRGQPASGGTTLYTVTNTAGKYAIVKNIAVCNVTSGSVTFTLANVPSGGSETDANRFMKNATVAPGSTVYIDLSMVFGPNESLRSTTSASASLTFVVSGVAN